MMLRTMKAWLAALVLALAVSSPSQAGLVSLPTTWTNAQVLTHSALNNEFTAITDQVNGSLNEANLAATITFADGDFLDLSAINASSATEGIKFPQAASITSATGEGVCAWDSDDDEFRCGNGSTVGDWNMIDAAIMDPSPQLVFRDTTDDTSYMWHVDQADATVSGFALWKGTKTSATGSFTIESGQWWPLIEFTPNRDIRLWGDRSLIVDELTNRGLLLGGGINGAVTATAALTNGQLPIGSTGAAPAPATLTGTASEVDITNGAGTITIGIVDPLAIAKGGTGLTSLGDDAIRVGDSATTATARTITNCTDTGGNHLNYTQSTNSFSCGTTSSTGTDISARAFNSANISITDATGTYLTFDSERFDTDTIHSTVSNTGRLTATTAGKYLIICHIEFASNGTGSRSMFIDINASGTPIAAMKTPGITTTNGTQNAMTLVTYYNLAANDYAQCNVRQDSGGALNILASSQWSPEFEMMKHP